MKRLRHGGRRAFKPLTAGDKREIAKACDCPPDAKRGEACAGGWMRCNGAVRKWQEIQRAWREAGEPGARAREREEGRDG